MRTLIKICNLLGYKGKIICYDYNGNILTSENILKDLSNVEKLKIGELTRDREHKVIGYVLALFKCDYEYYALCSIIKRYVNKNKKNLSL